MPLLLGHEELHRRLQGEEPKRETWLVPGLRIERREQKEIVIVDPMRIALEMQEPSSGRHAIETLRQRIHLIEEIWKIPDVTRWGCRTVWIEPFSDSIEALTGVFRTTVFGGSDLAKEAADLAAVFEFKGEAETEKITVSCGPMWPDQLRQRYVPWSTGNIPEAFLLVDVDFGATVPSTYSRSVVGKFLDSAMTAGDLFAKKCIVAVLGAVT